MAAPHVSGVLALLLSYRDSLSPEDLTNAILGSARESTDPLNTNIGIIDALSAIELVESGLPTTTSEPECMSTQLSVQTDQYGSDTAYRLRAVSNREVLWFGVNLRSRREYRESSCLDPEECYRFDIRDSYGDGIIDPGGIILTYNGAIQFSGGNFGRGFYIQFGNC
jgi:hypothetical protein